MDTRARIPGEFRSRAIGWIAKVRHAGNVVVEFDVQPRSLPGFQVIQEVANMLQMRRAVGFDLAGLEVRLAFLTDHFVAGRC